MNDFTMAAICSASVVALVAVSELVRRQFNAPGRLTRLAVHTACGVLSALAPWLFHSRWWPTAVAAGAMLLLGFARLRGLLPSLHAARPRSYGTVWFPLSAILLYQVAWDTPVLVAIPLLVMAFADTAGVLVGEGMRSPRPLPAGLPGKTWDGSVAVFAVTGLAVSLGWEAIRLGPTAEALLVGLACAPIAAVVESLSRRGLDNLTLPLAVAFTLVIPLGDPANQPMALLAAEGLAAVVVIASVRWGALRPDGGAGAFLLAAWLLGGGGWPWTLPVLLFFVSSSLLSSAWPGRREGARRLAAKGSRRDFWQVAANGGIALLAYVVWLAGWADLLGWAAFGGAVAAVTADTWSTEVGTALRAQARLITTGRRVPAGTSGGVSLPGTMAALLGAVAIGATVALLYPEGMGNPHLVGAVAAIGGIAGSVMDSLLGATLQVHYRLSPDGTVTERKPGPEVDYERDRGLKWLNNDSVNAVAAVSGALVAAMLAALLIG
jgi:uncharacterized protein (TIGR00297 family)